MSQSPANARSLESLDHAGRVLVVDDDRAARTALVRLLRSFGYQVFSAMNGLEALELLAQDIEFDVILSDVDMPGMNGREFKRELDRRRIEAPLVLVSGEPELTSVSTELGAASCISKPCSADDLRRTLADLEKRGPGSRRRSV